MVGWDGMRSHGGMGWLGSHDEMGWDRMVGWDRTGSHGGKGWAGIQGVTSFNGEVGCVKRGETCMTCSKVRHRLTAKWDVSSVEKLVWYVLRCDIV